MRRLLFVLLTVALMTTLLLVGCTKATTSTVAQSITLHFANFDPPVGFVGAAHQAFADELQKRTNGKYKVDIAWGGAMGKTEDHYDLARNGVADISYFLAPLTPGLFPMSDIISLPWRLPNANVSVNALWQFYKLGYLDKEYSNVVPIFLWAGSGQSIFMKNEVSSLNDLKGKTIISHSEMNNDILSTYMGAVPVFIPHPEMYGAVQKGTADGLLLVWEGIAPFSLQEQLHYAIDLAFGNIGCVVAMNKDSYNKLPKDVQNIIKQIAEDTLLPKTIEGYNNAQSTSKDLFGKAGGKIVQLPASEISGLEQTLAPMWGKWISQAEAKGLPGKEAVNKMYNILKGLGVENPAIGYKP